MIRREGGGEGKRREETNMRGGPDELKRKRIRKMGKKGWRKEERRNVCREGGKRDEVRRK